MALPDGFVAALAELGEAFDRYEELTGRPAILVGGAAAAIHTEGAFMSADFDVVAGLDDAFCEAMEIVGFVRDMQIGHGSLGWYHPDHPDFSVEQVSGGYFDGRGDRERCLRLAVREGSTIVLPAIEDMIADRLAQHEVAGGDDSMLHQARALFLIARGLDITYLQRRVAEEGGNLELLGVSDE
jgi:hypothetical protein